MDNERIPTMPQTSEERIPTMPQVNEDRIPTMPQGNEERIPTMPQNASFEGRVPTMPQNSSDGRVPTMPQNVDENGRIATMPQQVAPQGTLQGKLILTQDCSFTGEKGGSFVIEASQVVSADSGESQIYKCKRAIGTGEYVARVLLSVKPSDDQERRNTRDKVIKFLDAMSSNDNSHILPLIDYGQITVDGTEYYVEVYPFCEGGDLGKRKGKIPYDELCDKIIPAINEALHLFHNAGFVHRDVKPDNLYMYNGKVVIGDFGITCDLREDGFATDRYKTGTLGFYAPELMSQAAIKASDYYSFGQTIWTLYSGEMMYRNILRHYKEYGIEEQRNQVNFAMLNNVYYGLDEIGKEEEFFEILIRGLLKYDPTSRFDYEKVNRWLKGDKSVSHDISQFDSKAIFKTPFKFNGKECWDSNEIYDILSANWESAKELLYSGTMKDFYVSFDFGVASEIDKIVKSYSMVQVDDGVEVTDEMVDLQNDIGLSRFLMLLNEGETLVWRSTIYKSFNGIAAQIGNLFSDGGLHTTKDFTELLASELPGYWYQYKTQKDGSYNENLADVIGDVRALARSNSEWIQLMAYTSMYYLFIDNSEAEKYKGCSSIDQLVEHLSGYRGNVTGEISQIAISPLFYGFLFANGYSENAIYIIQNIENGESRKDLDMIFDLLDTNIENKNLRESLATVYREYGPYAHLLWWKNHLSMYMFKTAEANQIKNEIESVSVEANTISELRNQYNELEQLSIRFRNMFVDNIFLAQMGLDRGRKDIASNQEDAYWHCDYCGYEAPIGFMKESKEA